MSVQKVERRVDTVIIQMDVSVAEQLIEILDVVQDNTRKANSYQGSDIRDLQMRLQEDAEVRFPSPLYFVNAHATGYVTLENRI